MNDSKFIEELNQIAEQHSIVFLSPKEGVPLGDSVEYLSLMGHNAGRSNLSMHFLKKRTDGGGKFVYMDLETAFKALGNEDK